MPSPADVAQPELRWWNLVLRRARLGPREVPELVRRRCCIELNAQELWLTSIRAIYVALGMRKDVTPQIPPVLDSAIDEIMRMIVLRLTAASANAEHIDDLNHFLNQVDHAMSGRLGAQHPQSRVAAVCVLQAASSLVSEPATVDIADAIAATSLVALCRDLGATGESSGSRDEMAATLVRFGALDVYIDALVSLYDVARLAGRLGRSVSTSAAGQNAVGRMLACVDRAIAAMIEDEDHAEAKRSMRDRGGVVAALRTLEYLSELSGMRGKDDEVRIDAA